MITRFATALVFAVYGAVPEVPELRAVGGSAGQGEDIVIGER